MARYKRGQWALDPLKRCLRPFTCEVPPCKGSDQESSISEPGAWRSFHYETRSSGNLTVSFDVTAIDPDESQASGRLPARWLSIRQIADELGVSPGDDIEVAVYDIGLTGDGMHAYAFEGDSAGARVLRHGRLEVLAP